MTLLLLLKPSASASVTQIVTLAQVKAILNDTTGSAGNDAELQRFIDGISDVVEYISGPVRNAAYTQWFDAGRATILLEHRPVLSITSVTEYIGTTSQVLTDQSPDTATSLDANGYFCYHTSGVIERTAYGNRTKFGVVPWGSIGTASWLASLYSGAGAGRVKVVYTGGRSAVPAHIISATLDLIRVNYQQTQQGGRSSFGGRSAASDDDIESSTMVMGYLVPNRVREMLAPSAQFDGIG